MNKPFHLQIPTPCHENWANMLPSDKGRHCKACQKTVVDFTAMSDTEIIRYMSRAGQHVCGRLTPGQMNRPLIPLTPPQKNRLPGWPLLLTGIFLTHDKPMSHHPIEQTTQEQQPSPKMDDYGEVIGKVAEPGADSARIDTIFYESQIMGDISITRPQPDTSALALNVDSTVMAATTISIKTDTTPLPPTQLVVAGMIACPRPRTIDTLKQLLTDTLSALRILPQKQPPPPITNELAIYPNPVQRGIPFHLAWSTDPGKYQVSLFSSSGTLIQQRVIDINSTNQVSDWQIPTNAPAGIYIVRALHPGQTGVYARELVVQ